MLTFKNHEPIVDKDDGTIEIWDDEKNAYEKHSVEFIESLYDLTHLKKDRV
jgi:hypothetical protein